jgi:hypothetical protein
MTEKDFDDWYAKVGSQLVEREVAKSVFELLPSRVTKGHNKMLNKPTVKPVFQESPNTRISLGSIILQRAAQLSEKAGHVAQEAERILYPISLEPQVSSDVVPAVTPGDPWPEFFHAMRVQLDQIEQSLERLEDSLKRVEF